MKLTNPIPNSILKKWPVGNIYQGFAENFRLYNQRYDIWGHNGIDISGVGYFGRAVVASCDGIISNIYYNSQTGGQIVSIDSDKDQKGDYLHLVYGHLIKDSQKVKIGERVKTGQVIGLCGNTGFVISGGTPYWGNAPGNLGTHLHFTIFEMNNGAAKDPNNGFKGAVDPLKYLSENIKDIIPAYQSILTTMATMLRDMLSKLK